MSPHEPRSLSPDGPLPHALYLPLTAAINDGSTLSRTIMLEVASRTPLIAASVGVYALPAR